MKKFTLSLLLLLPLLAAAQTDTTEAADTTAVDCDCANSSWDDWDWLDPEEFPCFYQCVKQKVSRGRWSTHLDFAWGFHNWGSSPLSGLAGSDGDAAVRTSFNHILLTLNFPVLISRRVALYAGLGLDWDKYKFHDGTVVFAHSQANPALQSRHLTPVNSPESRLLTRYVVLPVSVCFDLGRHWKLELAAIPGLHWSGSHTGMRHDYSYEQEEFHIKDYHINRHINPFKLDTRVVVRYRSLGLYLQAAMLNAFRNTADELYPVNFAIIL